MADRRYEYSTSRLVSDQMGQAIDEMMQKAEDARKGFERRWYDNNNFDDGHHFRYLSRTENKIVDLSSRATLWAPLRAIPKSSRQIRGVANLLLSTDPTPIVYPEKINKTAFGDIGPVQPGQEQQPNEYKQALEEAKRIAKLSGHWVFEEFKQQNLLEKLALMVILAAKHGVSYLQVWPDAVKEAIRSQVYDAFDIYVIGSLQEITESPFLIKGTRRLIAEIKADERFDQKQVEKINPDNRHASSEIKEAYMKARYGGATNPDQAATIIEKEAFVKEYLSNDNWGRVSSSKNGAEILKGKKRGDQVIRHTFVAGNINLRDEYVNLPDYPFVDFRFEPGPIYQVPLIERFIPSNKSLDMAVSRLERFLHTMVTGAWLKRQGEQFEIDNTAGGQVISYQGTPPIQAEVTSPGAAIFSFIGLLNSLIEEQGVTTTTLGKLPAGVKANAAIESLKESEFANLAIAQRRLKGTVKRIAEKFLDIADDYFVTPQTVYYLEKGEPQYFDIIGASAIEKRKGLKIETPGDVIPLKKDYRVEIEVQSGLGYTKEGQKAAAKELGDYMIQLASMGLLPPQAVTTFLQTLLETYQFGPTQEIMEKMEEFQDQGSLTDQQIQAIKVSVLEVAKDLIDQGVLPDQEQRIEEDMVATATVIKDAGLGAKEPEKEKGPSESISFKDLPPDGKVQMAEQAGIRLSTLDIEQQQEDEFRKTAAQAKMKGGGNATQ